jgi:hypothetical protein
MVTVPKPLKMRSSPLFSGEERHDTQSKPHKPAGDALRSGWLASRRTSCTAEIPQNDPPGAGGEVVLQKPDETAKNQTSKEKEDLNETVSQHSARLRGLRL